MTVKNFIEEYIKNNDTSIIKKHITYEYLPFVKKCNLCERIIKSTYYKKNEDGTSKFYVDSVAKHMLFNLVVVDTYTDIDIDFNRAADEYDLLEEHGLFELIASLISERELSELMNILDMKEKDVIANEYEPHAFISSQIERFGSLLGISLSPALEKLGGVIEELDAEKVAQVLEVIDKVDKNKIVKLFK